MNKSQDICSKFIGHLKNLNITSESIQSISTQMLFTSIATSHWAVFHRKYAKDLTNTWFQEVIHSDPDRFLMLIYLANDIIQNSQHRGPEFAMAFRLILAQSFEHIYHNLHNTEHHTLLDRILDIWAERKIYPKSFLDTLRSSAQTANQQGSKASQSSSRIDSGKSGDSMLSGSANSQGSLYSALQHFEDAESASTFMSSLLTNLNESSTKIDTLSEAVENSKPDISFIESLFNTQITGNWESFQLPLSVQDNESIQSLREEATKSMIQIDSQTGIINEQTKIVEFLTKLLITQQNNLSESLKKLNGIQSIYSQIKTLEHQQKKLAEHSSVPTPTVIVPNTGSVSSVGVDRKGFRVPVHDLFSEPEEEDDSKEEKVNTKVPSQRKKRRKPNSLTT